MSYQGNGKEPDRGGSSRWDGVVFSRLNQEDQGIASSHSRYPSVIVTDKAQPSKPRYTYLRTAKTKAMSGRNRFTNLQPVGTVLGKKQLKRCCGINWTRARILWCLAISIVLLIVVILLALLVIGPKIGQVAIDGASMNLGATSITNPSDSEFTLKSVGTVTNAGFLDATLKFPDPLKVSWTSRPGGAPDILIGTLTVSPISVGGGIPKSGVIQLETQFNIYDPKAMSEFADYLIHAESFNWLLQGSASATAFGFITFNGLFLSKMVSLKAFNGLKDVSIQSFAASAGPDSKSVGLVANTLLVNPSDISIEMGDLFFTFMLGDGPGTLHASAVTLASGSNTLSMNGIVQIPQGSTLDSQIKGLGNDVKLNVKGEHAESKYGRVSWLNSAIKGLTLIVSLNLTTIAQNIILGADLALNTASISQVQENQFNLVGVGAVTNAGVLDATLKFPNPLSVYWTARPNGAVDVKIGELSLTSVSVSGDVPKHGDIVLSTTFKVTDTKAMGDFATFMIQGSNFSWLLVGDATANAFGIDIPGLSLSKLVSLGGFNGLPNPSIKAFNLPDSDSTGIHVVTTAEATNPSTITIDVGTVAFDLTYKDTVVGSLGSSNTILKPGANNLALDGRLKSSDSAILSGLFTTFLTGGGLNAKAVGKSSTVNNQQPSWLNTAFKSLTLAISLPSPKLDKPIVSNLNLLALQLMFDPSDTSGQHPKLSATGVTAAFNNPYSFHIGVKAAQASIQFVSNGVPYAQIDVPIGPASLDSTGKVVTLAISKQPLNCLAGQDQAFSQFFKDVVVNPSVNVAIQGTIIAQADTDAGSVTISGLPLSGIIPLSGLAGLSSVELSNVIVVAGDPSGLTITLHTLIKNPSTISITFNSDVRFNVLLDPGLSDTALVGVATLANMVLVPGDNVYTANVKLNGAAGGIAEQSLRGGLSRFINNQPSPISLPGHAGSSIYKSLDLALSSISPPSNFPPEGGDLLIVNGILTIAIIPLSLSASVAIKNPLAVPLTVLSLQATVNHQGSSIGTISHTLSNPTVIAPSQTVFTENLPLNPIISLADLNLLLAALQNSLAIDLTSSISAKLSDYSTVINYNQNGVPISVKF
ncbi:hypothetical protein BC830DRAFT_1225035 [Chytriomyces sp. MP71]|nr:hypothetical protein BC830DRAFT_1225035 [Chytriomyces sp. MP71]